MKDVQTKLDKVQNNIAMCSDRINQIKAVFEAMESEYQNYMQEQSPQLILISL